MKKILGISLALLIILTTCSFNFAKGFSFFKVHTKNPVSSIQKGLKSIAPNSNTQADAQITAQIENIKKTIASNNAITKQINDKKLATMQLIRQIRVAKRTLTSDQYTAINNLLTSANNEAKNVKNINGKFNMNFLYKFDAQKVLKKYSAQDLTNLQNTLNQNTTHLNNILASYTSIVSILNTAATTTPSAITLPVTTQSAISQ